jgi:hypothetical protein
MWKGVVKGSEITLKTTVSGKKTFKKAVLQKPGSFLIVSYRASSFPRDRDRDAMRPNSLVPQIVTQLRSTFSVHERLSQHALNEIPSSYIGWPMALHQALMTWAEGHSQSLSSTLSVALAAMYVPRERLE